MKLYYFEYLYDSDGTPSCTDTVIQAESFEEACRNLCIKYQDTFVNENPEFTRDSDLNKVREWVTNHPAIIHGGIQVPTRYNNTNEWDIKTMYRGYTLRGFMENSRNYKATLTEQYHSATPPDTEYISPNANLLEETKYELEELEQEYIQVTTRASEIVKRIYEIKGELGLEIGRPDTNERQLEPEI